MILFISFSKKKEFNGNRIEFIIKNEKGHFRISSLLMQKLIETNSTNELNKVFKNLKFFDNQFVIDFCFHYKNKNPLPKSYLKEKISKYELLKSNKLDYYSDVYDYLFVSCENENEKFVKYLLNIKKKKK